MTTRRSHDCNLCHSTVSDGTGVGLVWAGDKITLRAPSFAETHVCQKCITALEAALEDQREAMRKRDEVAAYDSVD